MLTSASSRCLDGGDVDLPHGHHRLEDTLGLAATGCKRIDQHTRGDLPRETPAILAPTALAFRASVAYDRVPITIRLFLRLRRNLEGKGLGVLELRAAIETEAGNAKDGELHSQLIALLAARIVAGSLMYSGYFAVRKSGCVETRRLVRLFVEPEADRVLWLHLRVLLVLGRDNVATFASNRTTSRYETTIGQFPNDPDSGSSWWITQIGVAFTDHARIRVSADGYLLHGPPGNGKTSVIRAMLSHPGISGFAANLVTSEMDDDRLQAFFRNATENTPALVVLEDIDRLFFGLDKNEKSNVSLQQLLNCLDGVSTQDGMIVVATANHPEVLDTAILRRPGRFDRVIEFGNPTKELRSTYLQKMCPTLVEEALNLCATASEGLSFAQLRESYILAGQTAFEAERDVTANDLTNAIQLLQATMNKADRKRTQKSGFDLQDSTQGRYARSCFHDR